MHKRDGDDITVSESAGFDIPLHWTYNNTSDQQRLKLLWYM